MGIGKFQPPTISVPLNQSKKNSSQLITSARGPPIPNLVKMHPLKAFGQMDEIIIIIIIKYIFIYLYLFSLISLQVRPAIAQIKKKYDDVKSRNDVPFRSYKT